MRNSSVEALVAWDVLNRLVRRGGRNFPWITVDPTPRRVRRSLEHRAHLLRSVLLLHRPEVQQRVDDTIPRQ